MPTYLRVCESAEVGSCQKCAALNATSNKTLALNASSNKTLALNATSNGGDASRVGYSAAVV